ncbi:PPOX class F420-dependent oxidoreductase [Tengunoibacter tsumagoiensis]|uniref:PPOX class F420-dependent oxidoreductase n=1 Tax=Tengunoibacter tsumagoiensis TaxID=2014871 RepID=A0A402AAM1_9CHLR|nr:PPOX class F420-dependent oxidoreductase [Tengunoibacter tsumagoiensis]GCE16148.1 PPOX class F420-dependent oxidoreductase [Tengunoibacter tsumagoiensis]
MSHFTPNEIKYLSSQPLGRLATVNSQGDPHVVPVSFRFNAELDTIDIGGFNLSKSKKFREAVQHGRVAFVVDDVLPPWQPRGVEVRGLARAETLQETMQEGMDAEILRITSTHITSWGIDSDAYHPSSRSVHSNS